MEAPTNKASGAFTKPVDRLAGEATEKWEKVRPKQPPAIDQKTGEMVYFLFSHRGSITTSAMATALMISLTSALTGWLALNAPFTRPKTPVHNNNSVSLYFHTLTGLQC